MMTAYSLAFFRANKVKTAMLCLSLAVYFALVVIAAGLHRAIPEIARLPLKSIGTQTIVQKTGKIPEHMIGSIFPHSNAPISGDQFKRLAGLPFVENADRGLYFWYFDAEFFKAALGVDPKSTIILPILKANIEQGELRLGERRIAISAAFGAKHGLNVGDTLTLGEQHYEVSGVLRSNLTGNIIPADFYMSLSDALEVVRGSEEMNRLYRFGDGDFSNVILLKDDPGWQGDKEKLIKKIDNKLLVFSEKTFTREITQQLGLVSAAGRILVLVLGGVLVLAFGLLTVFNLKSREKEIAILRMLGWRLVDLKRQFIGENFLLLCISILVGSCFALTGLLVLGRQTVSMELPWDISARPHFLPAENAIERVVSSTLPVHFDPILSAGLAAGFLLIFLLISMLLFGKLKNIKPFDFQER